MLQWVTLLALITSVVPFPAHAGAQSTTTSCTNGQSPSYSFGFADLKAHIGAAMGDPITCEFPDPNGTGDVHQRTSTGLAFWRKNTNTPTFTNGGQHWGHTPQGWVEWTGSSIDPPGTSSSVSAASSPNPSSSFAPFVGTWAGHGRRLDVQSNGVALLAYRNYGCPFDACDDFEVILQFTRSSIATTSGTVLSSTDPKVPTQSSVTLSLASDTVELFINGKDFANFCGAAAQVGACGA